jgi:hypothetical protein
MALMSPEYARPGTAAQEIAYFRDERVDTRDEPALQRAGRMRLGFCVTRG